ncbi:hypothetical protein ACFQ9X_33955 [Catenulispora yoronensis]
MADVALPADGAPWPAPRRVFLLAVAEGTDPSGTTAALQARLTTLGETDPQVEVFPIGDALPPYQRAARAMSALLWTAAPTAPIRLAQVYDHVHPESGPGFAPDREHLGEAEAQAVTRLLEDATVLLATTAALDDVLRPGAGHRVPVNFLTDGTWVWSDAIGYYAREHGVAPVPELLAHLRADRERQSPDDVALFRATAALTRPEQEG